MNLKGVAERGDQVPENASQATDCLLVFGTLVILYQQRERGLDCSPTV